MSLLNDMNMAILQPLITTFFSEPSSSSFSSSIINPHQALVFFSDHSSMDIADQIEKWVVFSDDDEEETETISLSDFPVVKKQDDNANCVKEDSIACNQEPGDFEFYRSSTGGSNLLPKVEEDHMCVADEVFFQGQIIPMDRCYSSGTNGSIGFRSNGSISRSQSTDSSGSSGSHRISISNTFYTHPSPKPHLPNRNQRVITSSRRTTSILQFGLVRTPEIDVGEYKNQRSRRSNLEKKKEPEEKSRLESWRIRFGCRCSPDEALEPISCCASTRDLVGKEGSVPRRRLPEEVVTLNRCHRTALWLNDLSVAKPH